MDLFDLLEKVFRGIVYFIYNVVETTATILRRPVTGPLELYRLHIRPNTRQLGGMTFLFLAFMGLQWALVNSVLKGLPAIGNLLHSVSQASATAPRLDINALWPLLLAALISTVLIDAILRLTLRWRLPKRRSYRQMLLSASEYALLWMVFAAFSITLLYAELTDLNVDFADGKRLLYGWGVVGVLAGSYPAAKLLGRAGPLPFAKRAPRLALALSMIGLSILFYFATLTGMRTALTVQIMRESDAMQAAPVHIKTLECAVQLDGRILVDGLIYVEHSSPKAFADKDFALKFVNDDDDQLGSVNGEPVEWGQPQPNKYVVASETGAALVQLRTRDPAVLPPNARCRIDTWAAKWEDLAPEVQRPGGPAPSKPNGADQL